MKKLTLIFCVALISSGTTFAQQKSTKKKKREIARTETAPVVVKDAFQQTFAETAARWRKNSGGHWVASFKKDDIKTIAEYDANGSWVATRSEYAAENLPETVASTLKARYPEATIKDGWKIERADVAAYYKINIQQNGADKAVLVNDAGTIAE